MLSGNVIAFAIFVGFTFDPSFAQKIRLEEVKAITLEKGKMAASRRYSQAIAQLVCTGGGAGCHAYTPNVVRCINEGSDGFSIQWECKADMPEKYAFGTISVVCEGYDYPEDPYILKGSCSLEYALEYSGGEYQTKGKSSYYKSTNENKKESQWGAVPIVMVLVFFGYIIYSKFLAGSDRSRNERASGPDIGWNIPQSDHKENTYGASSPPPYSARGNAYSQYGFRYNQANQGLQGGSGFWTGLGTGGLLGYLFGSQRNSAPTVHRTSSHFSENINHRNDSEDGSSSSIKTATAYGGTRRR